MTTFRPGDGGEINGAYWRVNNGRKTHGDMAIELRTADWVRTKMALPLLLCDFHYQVEEILFPRATGRQGGEYFLTAAAQACRSDGWEQVAHRVELERNGGRYPVRDRYKPTRPWEGREDQGAAVGKLRTAVTNAMWNGVDGADCAIVVQRIRDVLDGNSLHWPPPKPPLAPPPAPLVETPREFCVRCRSHFCPHVAAHMYRPPFTKTDELDEALADWEARWPA